MSTCSRNELLEAAVNFCEAFAAQKSPEQLAGFFSDEDDEILVLEHGLPQLAPFLGREFRGSAGLGEYLGIISRCLTYANMRFGNYVVDAAAGKVSVRGEATFTWTSTRQNWDEVFTYVLAFNDCLKVTKYEVWADSGAAYLAGKGELS